MLARIRFEHIPGKSSPFLYQMSAAEKPLEISGIGWIHPTTGEIYRIEADIGNSLTTAGIKKLRADLFYGPIVFAEERHILWLPVSATIDLETPLQHWRNIHRFADYRRYRVEVKIEKVADQP